MAWLREQAKHLPTECVMYVYQSRRDLNLTASDFAPCRLMYRRGYWPEAVRRLPKSRWRGHDLVLLWFADNVVPAADVDLQAMADVMETHDLDAVSLSYRGAIDDTRECPEVMRRQPREPVGRITNFIEFNFAMMRPWTFRCLQAIVNLAVNPMGWGLDMVFPKACGRHRAGELVRMAVLDSMRMQDMGTGTYAYGPAGVSMVAYLEMQQDDVLKPGEWRSLASLSAPAPAEEEDVAAVAGNT